MRVLDLKPESYKVYTYKIMSKEKLTWIYRTGAGQIKGPFSTEKILQYISEGQLIGSELIAVYPNGNWELISKRPQFYDALLVNIDELGTKEFTKKEVQGHLDSKVLSKTEMNIREESKKINTPNTPIKKSAPKPIESDLEGVETSFRKSRPQRKIEINNVEVKSRINKSEIIDLESLGVLARNEILKRNKTLIATIVVFIILLLLLLNSESENHGDKIALLGPGPTKSKLGAEQVRAKMSKAISNIEADEVENYIEAQNNLVSVLESDSNNLEARGLLCLTHKQLWPFSSQGASDLKTVSEMAKTTKQVNISSPYGDICEYVKLFVNGKFREVKGLLASALELESQFSLLPVLYYFKGETLEIDKDLVSSAAYFDQAGRIWEKWISPKLALADIYRRQGRAQDSAALLNWILKRNPKHKAAKIEIGVLWHKSFKNPEKAFNFLSAALNSTAKVSKILESEGYLSLAEIMLERNDLKRAKEYAQKGYILNPINLNAKQIYLRLGGTDRSIREKVANNNELMFLGDQFARQGDNLAAQAEYKAAFEADPKNGTAAMRAAKSLWILNQSFESIDWLKKAVKADPKLMSAYVLLADYLSQKFDFEGARQVLGNAISIDPGSYEVLKGLANMELRRNNIEAALIYAQKSLKAFDGDVETYIILANANFALGTNTSALSKKEIEIKETAQRDALRFATKAIELDSTNAEAQISYANILAQASGIEMSISYLKEKIKKFSYSTEYRLGLAKIYQTEDRFTQAKEIYSDIVEADPKSKKAFIGLGQCNKALGLNDLALKNLLKAAVIDPSDGEALFHAGILYLELNRSNEAINQFQRVQKLNPFFPKTNYYLGKAHFQLGNFKEALSFALAEKKKNPELADAYILAAEVYEIQKQFAECAAEYSAAIKKRHFTSETFVRAAQCYRQSGSLDVAENMLEQALTLESGYAEIYKEQGALFEMRGDLRAASASYSKYIGLAPNAKDRAEIEQKINALAGGQ